MHQKDQPYRAVCDPCCVQSRIRLPLLWVHFRVSPAECEFLRPRFQRTLAREGMSFVEIMRVLCECRPDDKTGSCPSIMGCLEEDRVFVGAFRWKTASVSPPGTRGTIWNSSGTGRLVNQRNSTNPESIRNPPRNESVDSVDS